MPAREAQPDADSFWAWPKAQKYVAGVGWARQAVAGKHTRWLQMQ